MRGEISIDGWVAVVALIVFGVGVAVHYRNEISLMVTKGSLFFHSDPRSTQSLSTDQPKIVKEESNETEPMIQEKSA